MDALDFIQKDLERRPRGPWAGVLLVLGAAMIPVALGLGLRATLDGAFDLRVFIPNVCAALMLGLTALKNWRGEPRSSVATCLVLALLLGTERVIFPPGGTRTTFPSPDVFWLATTSCFTKGAMGSAILGLWLAGFAFILSPWPTRRRRVALSFAAGISGTVMLGFHCDSSSLAHVLIGHVGQGVAVGLLTFALLELAFRLGIRANLPELRGRIRNPGKLG